MEYVKVGIIINTFGIKGEVKVEPLTDFLEQRFKVGQQLYIDFNGKYLPVVVNSFRMHKGYALIQFEEKTNINDVEKYKNCELFISKDDIPLLSKGSYYFFELQGCEVYNNDKCIGVVSEVIKEYQIRLKIKDHDKEVGEIPYVDAFIKNVNIADKRIDVEIIEGLL